MQTSHSRRVALLLIVVVGCQGKIGDTSGMGGNPPGSGPNDPPPPSDPGILAIAARHFPGEAAGSGPKRVFRLTRTQLDITTKTLLPTHHKAAALDALPPDPLQTNYEYSANLAFSDANFTPYLKWVDQIVTSVSAKPESVIDCAASGGSAACLQAEAKKFVTRAFRGVTSDAQLGRFAELFSTSVPQVGLADATADLVRVTLTSPSYVFREEVLTDAAGLLAPAQRLQNLTYTLADAPPETVQLSSFTPNTYLQTPDAFQKAIDRVLATAEARAKLLRFFFAWLEIKDPDEFTIAPSVFPEFTPAVAAAALEETRAFLAYHLAKPVPRLPDLTTATQSFVPDALASIYGVKSPSGKLVDLDPAKRLGVFTQPAVIASHSGPTTTRLVKRGVFFTRKVMCLPLGSPPPGIDTTVPPGAGITERQKIEGVTMQPMCAGCHAFINPFGFMQENYDAIGRWRTTDQGQPIDASISVSFLDEGKLTASSPVEALKAFTSSMYFKQCFVRQLFRFYLGRDEVPTDDPMLRKLFLNFVNNDEQAIVGLLRGLGSAPSFSQRSEKR